MGRHCANSSLRHGCFRQWRKHCRFIQIRLTSLLDHANEKNLLEDDICQLFKFFGTNDFELMLRLVWQASNINKALDIPDERTRTKPT